jgi:hypothetical protein
MRVADACGEVILCLNRKNASANSGERKETLRICLRARMGDESWTMGNEGEGKQKR